MRGIVQNVLYDTETATLVARGTFMSHHTLPPGDIYRTPNGRYFRLGEEGHIYPMDESYVGDWIAQNVELTDEVVKLLVDDFGLEIG